MLIGGRLFSARSFCEFRAFCGNLFPPTDFTDLHRYLWCAVLPQNSQNTQNLAAWVWQGCHTLLICAHPCHLWEALLCQKFLCVPCVLWEYLFSHGFHRFTQILMVRCSPTEFTEYTEFGSVGMQQGCHTLLHLCSSVSSVGVISLQEVLCIRCIPWELLHRLSVGAAEAAAPPGLAAWVWQGCHTLLHL